MIKPLPRPFSRKESLAAPVPETSTREIRGAGVSTTLIVGVILALIVIVLAFQNTERVMVEFLSWDGSTPLVAVILASALAGVVFDELAGVFWRRRRRRQLADRTELDALRSASLDPSSGGPTAAAPDDQVPGTSSRHTVVDPLT